MEEWEVGVNGRQRTGPGASRQFNQVRFSPTTCFHKDLPEAINCSPNPESYSQTWLRHAPESCPGMVRDRLTWRGSPAPADEEPPQL